MRQNRTTIALVAITICVLLAYPFFTATSTASEDIIAKRSNGIGIVELSGLPNNGNYNYVVLADVNKDSYPDIIASGAGRGGYFEAAPGGVHVYVNRNGTSFVNESNGLPVPGDEDFHATHSQLQLVDINKDSNLDIVAAEWLSHQYESRIRIYLGNAGEGGSIQWTPAGGPELYGSWSGVACDDIDGDGHLDLVAGGAYGLNVWKGNHVSGVLNWTDASTGIPDSIHHVTGIELADVNHDGRLDIVTGMEEGPGVQVYTCSETGQISWTEAHSGTAIAGIGIVWDVVLTNLNGDAHLDLITSGKDGIRAYLGNGNVGGRSAWWYDVSNGLPSSGTYYQLAIGDMDNDGNLDIGSALQVWSNSGSMSDPDAYSWEEVGYGLPDEVSVGMAMGDLDLDGSTDIVCCGWETNFPGIHAYTNLTLDPNDIGGDGGVPPSNVPGERVWFVKKDIMEYWTPRPDTQFVFVAMIGWSGLMVQNTQNDQKIGYENAQLKNTMGAGTAQVIMANGWKTVFVIYDDSSQNLPALTYDISSYPFINPYNWPYGLDIIYFDGENSYQVSTADPETQVKITTGSTHKYTIDWDKIKAEDSTGVQIGIDANSDGVYESALSQPQVDENVTIRMMEGLQVPTGDYGGKGEGDGKNDGKGTKPAEDTDDGYNTLLMVLVVVVIIGIIVGVLGTFLLMKKTGGYTTTMTEKDGGVCRACGSRMEFEPDFGRWKCSKCGKYW